MSRMSDNDECRSRDFGDSSQLTNWILFSGATCHMTPQVYNCIPVLLDYTDKHIEVADGNHVTGKQRGEVRIKICDDNRDNFIATLHNALLAPDLCGSSFSIITLMNSEHTCLLQKGFCTV